MAAAKKVYENDNAEVTGSDDDGYVVKVKTTGKVIFGPEFGDGLMDRHQATAHADLVGGGPLTAAQAAPTAAAFVTQDETVDAAGDDQAR